MTLLFMKMRYQLHCLVQERAHRITDLSGRLVYTNTHNCSCYSWKLWMVFFWLFYDVHIIYRDRITKLTNLTKPEFKTGLQSRRKLLLIQINSYLKQDLEKNSVRSQVFVQSSQTVHNRSSSRQSPKCPLFSRSFVCIALRCKHLLGLWPSICPREVCLRAESSKCLWITMQVIHLLVLVNTPQEFNFHLQSSKNILEVSRIYQ